MGVAEMRKRSEYTKTFIRKVCENYGYDLR